MNSENANKDQRAWNGAERGQILEIGHGTTRDGPGWRSIVYFKGCNFHCRWCGSPHTMKMAPEILFYPERVKRPERLATACGKGALTVGEGRLQIDWSVCRNCTTHECAGAALDGSIELAGREATVDEIVEEVLPYRKTHPEYGVTLSGGEAALQKSFFLELLKAFKSFGMHTAVETNGTAGTVPEALELLDLVICDLKHMDPAEHEKWTGRSNADALALIELRAKSGKPLWVRLPVVPGVNDGKNLKAAARFLAPMKDRLCVELIGHHALGAYKWPAAGREYELGDITPPSRASLKEAAQAFEEAGLRVIQT